MSSLGNGILIIVSFIGLCFLVNGNVGCSSSSPKEDRPLVDEKYSLTADRKAMNDLRNQIPSEKKKENDELAFVLGLMSEVKKPPSEIRSFFDQALKKKRDLFSKDVKAEREEFTKNERKEREKFLKELSETRQAYQRGKHSHGERSEFYRDLDARRSEYFSRERDRRNDFESNITERRKNFDDYTREKTHEFNQDHRAYVKRYEEWKKNKESDD